MEVNELFKHRSITSCMRASYDTITSDFRSLVKQTWTTHVPFAVLLAIVLYFLLPNKPLHDWGAVNPMASFILQTIIYGATIVMAIVSFWHLLPRKQLCPKDKKRKIGKSLLRILRHFGGFFLTSFLGMIIVGIATFIAALPSIILIIAQFYSQLGALDGDPLGVPGYFTPLLFLVFTITFLLIIYALQLTIGQERVPFTIDAHRSPHQQYFANRSFIAKQVGNVRDVGAEIGYTWNVGFPIVVNAGIFNGSGLTNQKDYWTKGVNYSAKAQFLFPNVNLVLSTQKIKPSDITVTMYDGGITFHKGGFIAEAEYLYKHYGKDAFHDVYAFDGFVCYDIPVANPKSLIRKVSPLARYDFMSDHSDGTRYGGSDTELGALKINDYKRHRVTGGVTLSLAKPFISDIRINYEKYFYRKGGIAKVSEKDKIVVEFMTKF